MTAKKIRVVYKEPGGEPEIQMIPNDLDKFQKMVGGYIETVTIHGGLRSPFEKTVIIICNDEGKINGAAPNFICKEIDDVICGPAVFVGENRAGDDFGSLTEKDAVMICEQLSAVSQKISCSDLRKQGGRTNGRYN